MEELEAADGKGELDERIPVDVFWIFGWFAID
jgi:hypothetical protein